MKLKWIESEIVNPETYLTVIEALARRDLRDSAKSDELWYMFRNPDESARRLVEWIKEGNPRLAPHKRISLDTGEKTRILYTVDWPYRIVLIALQGLIAKRMAGEFSPRLYSYRKGLGTFSAHRSFRAYLEKKKRVFVAKRDVSAFGDSIDQAILSEKMEALFPRRDLPLFHGLLDQAIKPEFMNENGVLERLTAGIPSGSPLTPILENIYLHELDLQLTALCESDVSLFYARYGDDFVIACPEKVQFKKTVELADQHVARVGLRFSESKKVELELGVEGRYLEWLGASFLCRGRISPRPKHFRETYQGFLVSFRELLEELSRKIEDYATVAPILENALRQFLSEKSNPRLTKLLLNRNDPSSIKAMDENIRKYLVRWLHERFRMKKSEAWREVRRLSIPSLNYQRRFRWRL